MVYPVETVRCPMIFAINHYQEQTRSPGQLATCLLPRLYVPQGPKACIPNTIGHLEILHVHAVDQVSRDNHITCAV